MEFFANESIRKQNILILRILLVIIIVLAFFHRFFLFAAVLTALGITRLSRSPQQIIRIDETGIHCRRGQKTQWYFLWEEIRQIQITHRAHMCCLKLTVSEHSQMDDDSFRKMENRFYFEDQPEARAGVESFAPERIKNDLQQKSGS